MLCYTTFAFTIVNEIWTKKNFMCLVSLLLHAQQMPFQQKKCLLRMNRVSIESLLVSDSIQSFTCTRGRAWTCEHASLPVYCCRHTLAPLLCLPQTRPPSPFLLYLVTTATTSMQAGRRLTHLDYPPPHPLSLVIPRPPPLPPSSSL